MTKKLFATCYLLLSIFFLAGCIKKSPATSSPPRPTIDEPVNTVPISERVYTTLSVKRDGKRPLGKELTLMVADARGASEIEYDVEFQAGTLLQGGGGSIDTKKETAPFAVDVFLGTCSAGGACSYFQDIKGGVFILRFKGSTVGSLKGEWNYYASGNDGEFSSRDAKFQLSDPKLKQGFVVISQTLGLPKTVDGDVIAGPYSIDTTTASFGDGSLTMHLSGDAVDQAVLWRWDGTAYQEIKSSISGKTLTATISAPGTYLVTK